jgi:multisubunit Na+/H+ antiporter MnhC subunit
MMNFNWKFLVPLSIINVAVVAFLLQVTRALGLAPAPELANDFLANLPQALIVLAGNLVIIAVVLQMLRNFGRRERPAETVVISKEDEMLPAQVTH